MVVYLSSFYKLSFYELKIVIYLHLGGYLLKHASCCSIQPIGRKQPHVSFYPFLAFLAASTNVQRIYLKGPILQGFHIDLIFCLLRQENWLVCVLCFLFKTYV